MRLAKTFIIPYLKRFWLMLLSVIFVGAFGCGILIGLRNAYHSLDKNVNTLLKECDYPDLYAQTIQNVDGTYLTYLPDDFNEKMGINKAEYRATYTTTFSKGKNSYSGRLISYDENTFLKQHAVEGKITKNSVQLEYYFAQANNLKVGDTIKVKLPDESVAKLKINATIVSPEASVVKADPYSISSSRDFAYIYVPKTVIHEHSSLKYFNEILIDFKEGKEKNLDQTITALKEYLHEKGVPEITDEQVKLLKSNIAFATTKNDSEAMKFYDDALRGINIITISAPAVFFLVVLVVTSLFVFQIVKQCRKDIGNLRALGEKKSSISLIFISLSLIIGILSWAIGIGVGSLFTYIANIAYGSALKLFPQPFVLYPVPILISLGLIVFVTVVTSFLASLNIARYKPVEAMKALPPTNNNTPFLTRTVFKKAPIPLKVTISQTLRNINRYILSGICLLASGMLVFIALSLNESKNTMMTQTFETRLNYDVQVYFDNLPDDEFIKLKFPENDKNIESKTLIKYLPSEMVNTRNKKKETGLINGVKKDQDLIRIVDDYQTTIPVPKEGKIVLSTYHAHQLDAKVGDVIECNEVPLKVSAISNEKLYQVSYTNFEGYTPTYSRGSLLLKVQDQNEFFKKYKDVEHVKYIAYSDVIEGEFNDRMAAFSISSLILTIMAVIVGYMIVFNMMQTNLKEQKRSFATMRTLGYQRKSISLSNLFTSILQFIVSIACAIPIGTVLSKTLLKSISVPDQIYPFPKTWTIYVFTTLIVLAFLLVSHFLTMRSMKKWNLPESVKERE